MCVQNEISHVKPLIRQRYLDDVHRQPGANNPQNIYTAVTFEPFEILTRNVLHLMREYIFYMVISP